MNIPDCYDPIYQAERREAEVDENALLCEECFHPITGDYAWDINNEILCERCAIRKYRKYVEDLNYGD